MRDKYRGWCRRPRTAAEKRANQNCEYVRPSRRPHLLPDNRDYKDVIKTRNWKDHRKTQYRSAHRGARHEMIFDNLSWREQWALKEYFEAQEIPHNIEDIEERQRRKHVIRTKRVKTVQVPVYSRPWGFPNKGHQIGFKWLYEEVPLDKPKIEWYNYSVTVAHRVVWWSDKDIGIDFVLRRIEE